MAVIAVPDPGITFEDFRAADDILRNLNEFDPAVWGLPPYPE
jgi:hypothetical protein